MLLHQLAELALAHDGVVDAQPREFDLAGLCGDGHIAYHPVIQRPVRFKFQGAERVRDALQCVLNRVCEIVHRIDAPLVALSVMVHVADAVNDGVAHVEVAGGQVDLRAQRAASLGELAVFHALEQVEVFLDGAVAVRAYGGLADIAAELAELFRRQVADVGKALFDEFHGKFVVLFKIIRAVEEPVAPVKAQPVERSDWMASSHELPVFRHAGHGGRGPDGHAHGGGSQVAGLNIHAHLVFLRRVGAPSWPS